MGFLLQDTVCEVKSTILSKLMNNNSRGSRASIHNPRVAVLWPSDTQSQLIRKDPDARKGRRQEKGTTQDEMVGWHHRLDRHEFEQALGDGEGQGSLACCSPWGLKELYMTEQLNKNNKM